MTVNQPAAPVVAAALRAGLTHAGLIGRSNVVAEHLQSEELEMLVAATLAHLRSVPGRPAEVEGWTKVTTRDAAVMTWWAEVADLTDDECRRLGALRKDVYDALIEQHLIERGAGRSTTLLVSPAAATDIEVEVEIEVEPAEVEPAEVEAVELDAFEPESSGAWVLKLSPYLYDASRVFAAPDGRVHLWAVEDHARSAEMEYGDPVYLWVGDGDPYHTAGVWGVGHVAGPAVLGVPDSGWLDYAAAACATVFAVVDITLLDTPVTLQAFLDDPRLVGAEVVREPHAANPAVLTASEAAALAECLSSVGPTAEQRVA
jgi:hypothetical protein